MIEFKITVQEEADGVHVRSDAPPAPTATKAEIIAATKLSEKIRFWIKNEEVRLPSEKGRIIQRINPPGFDKFNEGN